MIKRIQPLQPEAYAPLPHEGKGSGEGLLKAEYRIMKYSPKGVKIEEIRF